MTNITSYWKNQTALGIFLRNVMIASSLGISAAMPMLGELGVLGQGLDVWNWLPILVVPFGAAIAIYLTEEAGRTKASQTPTQPPALVLIPGDFDYQERIADNASLVKQAA